VKALRCWTTGLLLILCCTAAPAQSRSLQMIAPDIPPHFDSEGKGRIADVVRAVLDRCGHNARFAIVPFGRHWKDYPSTPHYDGLATAEADQEFPGYSTKPFMRLQDGATVLSDRNLESIVSAEELAGSNVVAFPAADKILGIEALVPRFKSFTMRADRFDQIRLLLSSRADAVMADGLITANFIRLFRERSAAGQEPALDTGRRVLFRRIFQPGPQRLYFRDLVVAADFDRCFEELRADGTVERLAKPYVDRYRDILGDQYPSF